MPIHFAASTCDSRFASRIEFSVSRLVSPLRGWEKSGSRLPTALLWAVLRFAALRLSFAFSVWYKGQTGASAPTCFWVGLLGHVERAFALAAAGLVRYQGRNAERGEPGTQSKIRRAAGDLR